jgi:predicted permease
MAGWMQDLRYATRLLRRSPGFTAVAVLTLALGIGANTAIFSLVNGVFLKPLDVERPTELVNVSQTLAWQPVQLGFGMSLPDYEYYRKHTKSFADLAAHYATSPMHLGLSDLVRETASINGAVVTGNYFQTLRLRPAAGRLLDANDDRTRDGHPVAVISHDLWRTRFAGDPQVLQNTIALNGTMFTIVGVAPTGFHGATRGVGNTDVWIPASMFRVGYRYCDAFDRTCRVIGMIGRLAPGRTIADAQAELDVAARQLEAMYPEVNKGRGAIVFPLRGIREQEQAQFSQMATLLLVTAGLVLLTTCANLAGLLLARGASRRKEIAIRQALGAGRRRLVRQLFAESAVLAALGAATGLLVALWTRDLLSVFYANVDLDLDGVVLGVTAAVAVTAALLFGLLPAWRTSRPDVMAVINADARGSAAKSRLRDGLVVLQVALSVVLVAGAALLVQSVRHLNRGPGYDVDHIAMTRLRPSLVGYDAQAASAFHADVIRRLEALPGVIAASTAMYPPFPGWGGELPIWRAGDPPPSPDAALQVRLNWVGPRFFETLGTTLLQGREFDDRDTAAAPRVAILGEQLSRRLFPDGSALGRFVVVDGREHTVVGIARDEQYLTTGEAARPFSYLSYHQMPPGGMSLDSRTHIRVSGDLTAMLPLIRQTIAEVDANVPGNDPQALADGVATQFRNVRGASALLIWLAALALLLTTLGLYAVLAFSVTQRRRELAIRMAIGATHTRVAGAVVGRGAAFAAIGTGLGLAGAFVAVRSLTSLMYGVAPHDPATMVVVAAVLMTIALVASYVPARRAARVDPIAALRAE